MNAAVEPDGQPRYTVWQLVMYMLRLGTLGFGGPVVITVGFIGYLVAGLPGATVAALATFLPCYLFTVIPAPYFKRYGKLPGVVAFVDGITAAAVGAIAGSVVIIAKRTIVDVPTALIAAATIVLLWRFRKLQEPAVIAAAAILGLVIHPLLSA